MPALMAAQPRFLRNGLNMVLSGFRG
jgi:hypothetical protein